MKQRRKRLDPATVFILISLAVHVSIWLSLHLIHEPPYQRQDLVEVTYVPTPPTPTTAELLRQIVEQKDRINDEKDEKAKYLSAFDQKVIKETRAANVAKFNNQAAGNKGAVSQKRPEKKETKQPVKEATRTRGELPSLRDLSPQFAPQQGTTEQVVAQPGEAPATDDHLKDVNKGLQTLLSTREFVYYSYYQRIKQQIGQYWEPNVREKVKIVYKEGRTIASAHDRITQLMIVLDGVGNLVRIDVLSQSGVHDLDDAAIEAFRSAAPFPNPPKGMAEKDGTIKIRWDFILES